ncbi:helix-turn-helix domain-containing protein, partial [Ruminococcus bicirculans (ex Wegman et al. 2014)]|uniref:helix-turn-helix domain-containing protein n=1 Tax=Ruminococcus bicirculans (ex Wegman et al. 2014) TaxID=1160721 RepID=UPI003A90832A
MDTNEKATEILRNNSKEKADMFPREVEYQDYAFKASEKIKEICNERNINLPELSKETDLSLDKLKSYQRRNPAKMPVSALCNIADFLKVSLDYLFDRSDVKPVIEKEKSRQYGISPEGVVLCLFNA